MNNSSPVLSTPHVVFSLPFGNEFGLGHLMRQATLAQAAQALGYRTLLLSPGDPATLSGAPRETFARAFQTYVHVKNCFPSPSEIDAVREAGPIAAVILDDYRQAGHPGQRAAYIQELRSLGGTLALFDGVEGLEFDRADKIINVEFGTPDYPPQLRSKLIHGGKFLLTSPEFLTPAPLPERLPSGQTCLVHFGAKDPLGTAIQVLEALVGTGLWPVLLEPKTSPHAPAYAGALAKHKTSLWLDTTLSQGQLHSLIRTVSCSVIAPASTLMPYHLHCRTPFVSIYTNPSLKLNARAAEAMGLPVVWLDEQKVATNWGRVAAVDFPEIRRELPRAIERLGTLGYLENRLPERAPFALALDTQAPSRILKSVGLAPVQK